MGQKSVRIQRVEKELHHLVALYLQHDVVEPMPAMVSVTAVDVSSDLRKAVVYFRLVGEKTEGCQEILERHRKAMQKRVADLRLKFCPVLEFRYGQARAEDDVDRLLAQLGRKSAWSAGGEDET